MVILALVGCGDKKPPPVELPNAAQAGTLELAPDVYVVGETEYAADSGVLAVPENRDVPGSRLIALPITRVRATGREVADPIFFLNGGPGTSNMSFRHLDTITEKHDVVLVGYRGIDGSVRLDCPEVDAFFGDPPGDFTTQSALDVLALAYQECATRHQDEGVDTDGYNMIEVVHDVEAARVALGYDHINLLSQSYGTRLAMLYAWVYPETTHRSAMISVNPPGHFVWYPDTIDDQLRYYAALCSRDPECASRTDDLAETIRVAARDIPSRWLFFPIKKGNVLMGTFMMLYHTSTAPQLFDAWISASEGDWSGMALVSMAVDYMVKGAVVWGESAAKALSADYVFAPGSDPLADLMPASSIIGAPGSLLGTAAARGWPAKVIADSLRRVRPSDVPTLLISGSIDFSTPARFARDELLPHLSNGHQVILTEFGHTADVWWKQREAILHLLEVFFDSGAVDDSQFMPARVDFHVGLGYQDTMKLGLAAIVVVLALIVLVVWITVRVVRRRKARVHVASGGDDA